MNNDTIAAISTPEGAGGISIVRLSGKDALKIADRVFSSSGGKAPSTYKSHTVRHGYVNAPDTKEAIDEVILTVMLSPKTYTREDIVEINCHGGMVFSKKVLEVCLVEGARLAAPGEFTRRAFLNGRIDLSQAEAVMDAIKSETDLAGKVAARHLTGEFSKSLRNFRDAIIEILSMVELAIDFSEEDVAFARKEEIAKRLSEVRDSILNLIRTADAGMILSSGASIVISGRPNVGKSSLMNALLRKNRVIVAPTSGTTRDIIEESANIGGVKVSLADTAGIIDTEDKIEKEGVKRSFEKLELSDIVIFMMDYSRKLSPRDEKIYRKIKHKNVIIVVNKTDLAKKLDMGETERMFAPEKVLKLSILKKKGFNAVENAIKQKLFGGKIKFPEECVVTNLRHKKILEKTLKAVERARKVTNGEYNEELLASDLNEAVYELGLITGETATSEVLDKIFSRFCIGK
ncbi:MAG: tRNA uridine-5-carboxymethylaminomethyl(34) synthesis GTPase MnmE [Candidatus Omnitrophica bacterium]|nr:tRNA uridine-5-carboxymethylaminomethyl(34) synthesis GTPase MnmE [Candidatus Omnitrophota bacterium]